MQPRVYLDSGFFKDHQPAGWHDGGRHLRVTDASQLITTLESLEAMQRAGCWVVMALAYEAGWVLMDLPAELTPRHQPDIWLDAWVFESDPEPIGVNDALEDAFPTWHTPNHARYAAALDQVREAIASGVCYQINQTFQLEGVSTIDPWRLYQILMTRQPAEYGGFIAWPERQVLSRSPELFIQKRGDRLRSEPMKGTAARADDAADDARIRDALLADPKMHAENLMIVDLIRNDLSRVAQPGSVSVPALFESRPLKSVHQVSSIVEARVREDQRLVDILRALFPCGSVVGAPKAKAFEMIQDLEHTPRGIYTGSLGVLEPGGDFTWSVAIRTIDQRGHAVQLGLGSGVVADSDADAEWAECLLKGRFAGVGI
jgi:anthranilate/para-aminobenzoate synthase component I